MNFDKYWAKRKLGRAETKRLIRYYYEQDSFAGNFVDGLFFRWKGKGTDAYEPTEEQVEAVLGPVLKFLIYRDLLNKKASRN